MDFINQIIKKRKKCYFISPHFDDAILSAGGLIEHLSKHTSVHVVNVFTQADISSETISARQFKKGTGFANAKEFMQARQIEDARIMNSIKVDTVNLSYVDAIWRKKDTSNAIQRFIGKIIPELMHRYPLYRLHIASTKVSRHDTNLMKQLKKELKKTIPKEAVVFCPLGIGHIDHTIVSVVSKSISDPIFWLDQPYAFRGIKFPKHCHYKKYFEFSFNKDKKRKLIESYTLQTPFLFPRGQVPNLSEIFFK